MSRTAPRRADRCPLPIVAVLPALWFPATTRAAPPCLRSSILDAGDGPGGVVLGDFDGDGLEDVVVAHSAAAFQETDGVVELSGMAVF